MPASADLPEGTSIAIIGMSGRFPGAANIHEYWANLAAARECVTIHDRAALRAAGVDPKLVDRPDFVPATGTLEGIDRFDSGFFNFSPREAETMDPQQRLILECAWAAFEDAGYDVTAIRDSVGVYCGGGMSSYLLTHLFGNPSVDPIHLVTGNDKDFLATRISHKLNLRGPSVATQTACSSSLVAVHAACQALLANECDLALAGGVMISVTSGHGYIYQEGGVLSRDGRCRAFDREATGTVSGNGLGLVLLKPLEAARRDGDPIYAVIRGTAINNDGSRKVGFTAPSAESQRDVILEALSVAGVSADQISYVEAHGTGTRLGDVIEMQALTEAFRRSSRRTGYCAIGSVKTSIGHLDAAAGIAGLIKTALALRHRTLPASLHFREPNPEIDFQHSPFRVQTRTAAWDAAGGARLAGVSSFGIGGTNAHVILQEADAPAATRVPTNSPGRRLLRFSARTSEQVAQQAQRLHAHWHARSDVALADVTSTLALGRATFAQRGVIFADSRETALEALAAARFDVLASGPERRDPAAAWLFSDRPPARELAVRLYREHAEFRTVVQSGLAELPTELAQAARHYFTTTGDGATPIGPEVALLGNVALGRQLAKWGVAPCAAAGVSSGLLAAACLADALPLGDALRSLRLGATGQSVPLGTARFPVYCGRTGVGLSTTLAVGGGAGTISETALAALRAKGATVCAAFGVCRQQAASLAATGEGAGLVVFPTSDAETDLSADRAWWVALGSLWAHGLELRWAEIERGAPGQRISLPTYPFEPKSHWLTRPKPAPVAPTALARDPDLSHWCYQPIWKRTGATPQVSDSAAFDLLVIGDAALAGTDLLAGLRRDARRVITASLGRTRSVDTPDDYTISATSPDDYRWWLEQVAAGVGARVKLVHLGNLLVGEQTPPREILERGFYSVTFLAQAIADTGFADASEGRAVEMLLLTSEQADVLGHEPIVPEVSCLLGPARVIGQEYPGVRCRWVDLEALESYASRGPAARLLDAELRSDNGPTVVALRGRHRWLPEFEPVALATDDGYRGKIKRDGVYVITGGCGGLGLEFAKFLAQTEPVKLALLGRSELPPRAEWPALLAASSAATADSGATTAHPLHDKLRKISEIEALGSRVLVLKGDVTSPHDLAQAKQAIERELGPVAGLIHAAGLPFNGMSANKTPAQLAAILAPKVEGLRALERCFDFGRLDFVVLCSSLRSLTGGLGNLDYTAANACLDAFARRQYATERGHCVAINWDGWSEVGSSRRARADDPDVEILSAEGVEILRRALSSTVPQVVVSTRPLAGVLKAFGSMDVLRSRAPVARDSSPVVATPAESPAPASAADTEQILCDIWRECLGVPAVGLDDNFFELGGDSIVSIQVMAKAKAFGLSFTSKSLYDHPTVRELAASVRPALDAGAEIRVPPGAVPLLPAQHWFFEAQQPHPSRWNISLVVSPARALDPVRLEQAFAAVVRHHDALRLSFTRGADGWQQQLEAGAGPVDLRVVELHGLPAEQMNARMLEETGRTHEAIDLNGGALFKLVLFRTGQPGGDRLVVVSHHLIIDFVSWNIVIDDLKAAYEALEAGRPVGPLPRSGSFAHWGRRLAEHVQTTDWTAASAHWRNLAALPVDRLALPAGAADANRVRQTRRISAALEVAETDRLIVGLPQRYGVEVLPVLVAAVGRATQTEFGTNRFLLATESHGREPLFPDVDLSRAVGWFTSIYPLLVDVGDRPESGALLARSKDTVRSAARHGFDYGLLRYLRRDETLAALPAADIELNYLGAAGAVRGAAPERSWRIDNFGNQLARHPDNRRDYLLQLLVAVSAGRLRVSLEYGEGVHAAPVAEAYLARIMTELRSLILYCEAHPQQGFGAVEVDASVGAAELDDILQEIAAS